MKEKNLLKLAFIWSIIGILILILVAWFTEPALIEISSLGDNVGKTVIIQGRVVQASYKPKVAFLDVKDSSGAVTVVLFDLPSEYLEQGDEVQVKGKVEYYKSKLEMVADEIACISC